jgi:transcriptional regulator with XRE-family HTH domain
LSTTACAVKPCDPSPRRSRDYAESSYERTTPEKRAYGLRLKSAREAAGLSLTEAATALGYSQPVQLSLMENGKRIPTLAAIVQLSNLYGTTTDYLCGLVQGMERDPAVCAEALVAARVSAEVRKLISTMVRVSHHAVRELRPDAGRVLRLAGAALEAAAALARMRSLHPEFDDAFRNGAVLVAKVDVAAGLAREHIEAWERARRTMKSAPVDAGFALPHDIVGDDLPAAAFWPPRPIEPNALDPEPLDPEDNPWSDRTL